MKFLRKRLGTLVAVASLLLLATTGLSFAGDQGGVATFEVTVTNLTSGQPLTPPVLATHSPLSAAPMLGKPASVGIHRIAENGTSAWLLASLANNDKVFDVVEGTTPIVPDGDPGGTGLSSSATFTITADGGTTRLSLVSMLICTNDGFTGVDSLSLPPEIGGIVTHAAIGLDAGTELNTEDFADMVPPCQDLVGISSADPGTDLSNGALAEGGVITLHPGVVGGFDLDPAVHGWDGPVAEIRVERVS